MSWGIATARLETRMDLNNLSQHPTSSQSLRFKPDGRRLYYLSSGGDVVVELSLARDWLVDTASYVQEFSVAGQQTGPNGLFFRSDGLKMYVCGQIPDAVHEYDLSVAWDVSSAAFLQTFSVPADLTLPNGLFFKPDGKKMYVVDAGSGDDVNEFDLSSAWDISTAVFKQKISVSDKDVFPNDIHFKSDGTKMFLCGLELSVYEYHLSIPWDVLTAQFKHEFSVSRFGESGLTALTFSEDGSRMYTLGSGAGGGLFAVLQFTLDNFPGRFRVTSAVLIAGGTGYIVGSRARVYGGSFVSPAVVEVTSVGAVSAAVNAGGTGYSVNDKLTLVGGTFGTAAVFNVDSVSAGVVTAVSLDTAGDYTALPSNPVSTTGGGGSGATLDVTFGSAQSVIMIDGGHYEFQPTNPAYASGGGGSGMKLRLSYADEMPLSAVPRSRERRR